MAADVVGDPVSVVGAVTQDTTRRVRTFKPRRRPLTPTRAEQFERLAPRWCLDEVGPTFDPIAEFGRRAPVVVDIGIGHGESVVSTALSRPLIDLIGIDVHTPGIAATLACLDRDSIANVRLVHGDALVFFDRVASSSLTGIRVLFPDPWPKARHRHRRIIGEERLDRLVDRLAPGGQLHLATDIDDYALQMMRVCDQHPELTGGLIDRPDERPVTRYERKGVAGGRVITDLLYVRAG